MPAFPLALARLSVAALAALAGSAALAQSVPASLAENGRAWFVELAGRPAADGGSVSALQLEQANLRAAAQAAGIRFVERRNYQSLFNGLSIEVSSSDRLKLAKLPGVRAMYPVDIVEAPNFEVSGGSAADLASAIAQTRANIAQNTLGLTGAGIRVGIIDSGIDIDHPAFGGTGVPGTTPFPNARIVAGFDFVGDAYQFPNVPTPDAVPDDCGGHGTHVAGIVGANGGGLRGVAPDVTFGAYRVFGCTGSTASDIILAAMERALADGMNVINQSLGAARQWPQYPTAQAAARLAKKGVVMVASIGNNGPGGNQPDALFAAGAPGVADGVIGVASFDNTQVTQTAISVGGTLFGYSQAGGGGTAPTTGSLPMSRTGTPTTTNDACAALPAGSLTGTAVLIRRGTCGFYNKAINAQNAGAAAVVLYNNAAGVLSPTVAVPAGSPPGTPAVTIPVVMVSAVAGVAVNDLIAAGPQTLTWTNQLGSTALTTGGLISGFSSFGLAADLSFKPNIGAPGGNIFSSIPLEQGGQGLNSGTSMSAPHVAGLAALVLQAIPTAALGRTSAVMGPSSPPPINMMTRLMNTAKPAVWSGNPGLGFLDFSFRQGAGMADVVDAVQSTHFVVPASIATGESQAGPRTQRLTIRNDAAAPVTFTMGHAPALSSGPNVANAAGTTWVTSTTQNAPATVSFSSPTVTVPAGGRATVDVTIAPNPGIANQSLYGGYVTLTPTTAGVALRVPYAGFFGDYQTLLVLRASPNGFPWLSTFDGTNHTRCTSNCSYTMAGANNQPHVVAQFAHLSRVVKLEALDAATGASRGVITEEPFFGRNSTPAAFFTFPWDGTTSTGTQPNGTYRIRMTVLKALGNPADPAHTESWESPVLTIARP
jgi:minor extracellular serine protease Vpr